MQPALASGRAALASTPAVLGAAGAVRRDGCRRRRAFRRGTRLFLSLLALGAACHPGAEPVGDFTLRSDDGGLAIGWKERPLFTLRELRGEKFRERVSMQFGFFDFERKTDEALALTLRPSGRGTYALVSGEQAVGTLSFALSEGGNLRGRLRWTGEPPRGLRLSFDCAPTDRFWGFGEQYDAVDFRGRTVPIWTQEQGVGRTERPTLPFEGELTDSYFPMPYFLDPAQGKGFLLENSEYSSFDLCHESSARWSVELWAGEASFLVFPGPTPREVVGQLTKDVGRAVSPPPDWALSGVWLAAQGGRASVEERVRVARAAGVPVSAVWVQDWVGARQFIAGSFGVRYRWVPDEALYPDLKGMISGLGAQGVRFLGYFNPFVLPDQLHWSEGKERGYLARRATGEPYTFTIAGFEGGLLDVSNPEAAAWFSGYARQATALGMAGWMADFGEWLPYDAVIHQAPASAFHNRYPTAWHALSRQVLEEARPSGDFVLLTRSGFTGEHRVAQVVWLGDQEASFDEKDGLPTVVKGALTLGLSGVPCVTHDIAGFSGGPSDEELFSRWTELGAFTPVMRTHDGLRKLDNHRFDSTPGTLAHFRRFSAVHQHLLPYWKALARQAQDAGLPMIRHTALVDPAWPMALEAHAQWMVGDELLLAPVTRRGATSVEVHFPEGAWEHLLTGEVFAGRSSATVPAPLGTPAVFFRQGSALETVGAAVRAEK